MYNKIEGPFLCIGGAADGMVVECKGLRSLKVVVPPSLEDNLTFKEFNPKIVSVSRYIEHEYVFKQVEAQYESMHVYALALVWRKWKGTASDLLGRIIGTCLRKPDEKLIDIF